MEAATIKQIKESLYIPCPKITKTPSLPDKHPSLILQNNISDSEKTVNCGCKGEKCLKDTAHWIYKPNGEVFTPDKDFTSTESFHFAGLIHESHGRQL